MQQRRNPILIQCWARWLNNESALRLLLAWYAWYVALESKSVMPCLMTINIFALMFCLIEGYLNKSMEKVFQYFGFIVSIVYLFNFNGTIICLDVCCGICLVLL